MSKLLFIVHKILMADSRDFPIVPWVSRKQKRDQTAFGSLCHQPHSWPLISGIHVHHFLFSQVSPILSNADVAHPGSPQHTPTSTGSFSSRCPQHLTMVSLPPVRFLERESGSVWVRCITLVCSAVTRGQSHNSLIPSLSAEIRGGREMLPKGGM